MRSSAKTLLSAIVVGLAATLPVMAQEGDEAAYEVSEVTGEVLPLVQAPLPPIRREVYASLAAPVPAIMTRRPIVRTRLASEPRATGSIFRCASITCPHLMLLGTAF